jgi:enamine deaminase RidA (YjgF/YER057c/UK114 family)
VSAIQRFSSASPYEDVIGYSRVVRAGDWFVTAGCTATVDGRLVGEGDPYAQTVAALQAGVDALGRAGCPPEQIVSSRIYLTDRAHTDAAGRAHAEVLGTVRPVATMVLIAGFIDEAMLVEIELSGYAADARTAEARTAGALADQTEPR